MSDYAHVAGGSLKFKGGGVTDKKKKKKSHSASDRLKVDDEIKEKGKYQSIRSGEDKRQGEASGSASPAPPAKEDRSGAMTDAERRYYEVQKQRREERAKKLGVMTHKDRITQMNAKLDRLSDHHDMPKIGPG